jgi:hypothetical protein
MANSNKFEESETMVHVLEDDDGSILVDLDDIALLLRKRGRVWVDKPDWADDERAYQFGLLDHIVDEAVAAVKRQLARKA